MYYETLLIFCSLFLLGMACSQDDSLTATVDPVPEGGRNANPYAVTVEEALANLEGILAQIDGETRAGSVRRPVSVEKIKAADVCDLTRSEAALDVEDLLYVVSFGEGNGSAVLGADKRVTDVMAVLDETVLTTEDFVKFDTRATSLDELSPKEDLRNMLIDMITATAEEEIETADFEIELPEYPFPFIGYDSTYTHYNRAPLLRTKWDQDSPFNKFFPYDPDLYPFKEESGCVTIGIGQLLNFYQHPTPNIIGGTTFDWNLISQLSYPTTTETCSLEVMDEVAAYLFKLANMMNIEYTQNGSEISRENRLAFLRSIGFPNVQEISWDISTAYDIVYNNSEPLSIRAADPNSREAHFWLLDGWKRTIAEFWRLEKRHPNQMEPIRILLSSETSDLVHCNYGYRGYCDGYYAPNVYDLRSTLSNSAIDESVGDVPGTKQYNLRYQVRMMLLE